MTLSVTKRVVRGPPEAVKRVGRARAHRCENRAWQGRREASLRTQAADRGRSQAKVCSPVRMGPLGLEPSPPD